MNKFIYTLLFFFFAGSAFGGLEYKELLFIPWGTKANEAGFRTAPGGQFGSIYFLMIYS